MILVVNCRSKKRLGVLLLIVLIVFLLATSLPFLIQSLKSSDSTAVVNFVPLQNVYHQIYDRDDALLDRLEITERERENETLIFPVSDFNLEEQWRS